jgi:hypothetical protein
MLKCSLSFLSNEKPMIELFKEPFCNFSITMLIKAENHMCMFGSTVSLPESHGVHFKASIKLQYDCDFVELTGILNMHFGLK